MGLIAESAGLPDLDQTLARRFVVALNDVACIENEGPYPSVFATVDRAVAVLRGVE